MVGWKKRNGRTGSPFFLSQPQSDFKDRASSHLPFAYIKQHKYIYNTKFVLHSELIEKKDPFNFKKLKHVLPVIILA